MTRTDRHFLLPRGRVLGYAEYGDPDGLPVFSFHGAVSSRLDASCLDDACSRLGVRLIAPDRPGMGISDFRPGRTLLDWPDEVLSLADQLKIDRFPVLGWSAGGPYALACGYAIPDRVTVASVVASGVPVEAVGAQVDWHRPDWLLLALSRWSPRGATTGLLLGLKRGPAAASLTLMRGPYPAVDIATLRREGPPEEALAYMKESLRAGTRGVIQDFRIYGAPWGFQLEHVQIPVHIWQGQQDTITPPSYGRLLADRLPNATLSLIPGEGHISLLRNHPDEVMRDLRDRHLAALSPRASSPMPVAVRGDGQGN